LTQHPFSFSSSPERDGRIQMTIKELGDFTGTVGSIAPGTRAYLDGPTAPSRPIATRVPPSACSRGASGSRP
jgi:NAD(P)H-flavin reductase